MVAAPSFNPWLKEALRRAGRVVEDADRKALAAREFERLIVRVHRLACAAAIRCDAPQIDRWQPDGQSPVLEVGWRDAASGWELWLMVRREAMRKPYVTAALVTASGTNDIEAPTDSQVRDLLNHYFETWKRP